MMKDNEINKEDIIIKTNLSYAYRIIAKLGLDDHTYTHLSARPAGADYYFIYPFGMMFEEVTPEHLMKIDFAGNIIEGKEYQYNKTGYILHGNIYKARSDLNAIFHLHTNASVAVSALQEGLLPISQWALHFHDRVSYHSYDSLALDNSKHGERLVDDLGLNKVIFLQNHGFITSGQTIHEAMFYCYHLEQACKTQIMILSTNRDFITPPESVCKQTVADIISFERDLGSRDWQAWVRKLS